MFIKYQKVRNAVLGTTTALVGGVAAFFGLQGDDAAQTRDRSSISRPHDAPASVPATRNIAHAPSSATPLSESPVAPTSTQPAPTEPNTNAPDVRPPAVTKVSPTKRQPSRTSRTETEAEPVSDQARYAAAMKIAMSQADMSKGKDVLGPSSPWKLNLYDDDRDGQWDRGKLDTDRDEVDDEYWTYKKGRWEKDGGSVVWLDGKWSSPKSFTASPTSNSSPTDYYAAAMAIATARADASGKGKDVLGPSSPWKLNLYDDDRDGQWDRAKLDTNRDEVDDEKWNYKNGRWEKDGGKTVWANGKWTSNSAPRTSQRTQNQSADSALYQKAMKIATSRARSAKGKDVLGGGSPWKLNLYDDDRDGQWDRGKLDTNRDDVDDEKWNFKNGRWEKDGGQSVWNGTKWTSSNR